MPIPTPPDPRRTCPYCERTGMVGHEREFAKGAAATVFKCHNCNRTWRVPDREDSDASHDRPN